MKITNNNCIVVVDDNDVDIMLMQRFIKKSSLQNEFIAFDSGIEFLKYMDDVKTVKKDLPALVFLDINMPQMDGFEVLAALRKQAEFESIPVVMFLTNSDRPEDIQRCEALNAGMQEKFRSSDEAVDFLNSLAAA